MPPVKSRRQVAQAEFPELVFELDYIFEKKDVFSSFRSLGTLYSLLHDFDRSILVHLHPDLKLEYRLEHAQYGSLKTRVVQILKGVPDEMLISSEVTGLIGTLLVTSKYWLLDKLSNANDINSKSQVEEISKKINNGIEKIGKKYKGITTSISPLSVFKSIDEIAYEVNKLPRKEAYQYKSKFGNALLKKGITLNKPKILSELGSGTESTETTEIVKPKKVDLLGESKWDCIWNGRTREMKVEDKEWLEKIHQRKVDIQSGDSLKVKLFTVYGYDADSKTKINYTITKVLAVIKPDDTKQLSFL